jgi:hypothetical protein
MFNLDMIGKIFGTAAKEVEKVAERSVVVAAEVAAPVAAAVLAHGTPTVEFNLNIGKESVPRATQTANENGTKTTLVIGHPEALKPVTPKRGEAGFEAPVDPKKTVLALPGHPSGGTGPKLCECGASFSASTEETKLNALKAHFVTNHAPDWTPAQQWQAIQFLAGEHIENADVSDAVVAALKKLAGVK